MKFQIYDKQKHEYWDEELTPMELAKSNRFPSNAEQWYDITPVYSEDSSKAVADRIFHTHETFMVRLCAILELDYMEASEEDVLDAVKKYDKFIQKLEKRLEVAARFCIILKCRSCDGYYAEGYVCECGRDHSYSDKEWEVLKNSK